MQTSFKRKIFLLLDPHEGGSRWDRLMNALIITLIVLNTIAVMVETIDSVYVQYSNAFRRFELFSVAFFSIEYVLRVWTITESRQYGPVSYARVKYMLTPGALIDLIAVIPFYLPMLVLLDLRFLRIFRLVRFLRFFKLGRYLNASKLMLRVFRSKKEELVLSFL